MPEPFRACFLVPVFNHAAALPATIARLAPARIPCILVDDGSDQECRAVIDHIAQTSGEVTVLTMDRNRGKGAAVKRGLRLAGERGFSHVVQIDADGQHDCDDVARFLAAAQSHPDSFVIGAARFDTDAPRVRRLARYLTHVWVWINTLSLQIEDSMCGFRVYPVAPAVALLDQSRMGNRMEFDTEILVRAHWHGCDFVNVPTRVHYPADGISHFRLLRDNLLISMMHARLFAGLLLRFPVLLWRRARR